MSAAGDLSGGSSQPAENPPAGVKLGASQATESQESGRSGNEEQSSDDDEFDADDAESILGVSIGREQARLAAPSTPAAEKSAALDRLNSWGFFDGVDEEGQQEVLQNTLANTNISSDAEAKVPTTNGSPGGREWPQRSSWFANLRGINHARSSSGSNFFGDGSFKRFFPTLSFGSSFESVAARIGSSQFNSSQGIEATDHAQRRGRSSTLFQIKPPWKNNPSPERDAKPNPPRPGFHARNSATATPIQTTFKATPLRRSTSLDSFRPPLSRQSTVTRLENEGPWDNVTQQVNSRRRAIKDAFQDTLPQMPNLNLSQLRPDLAFKNFWDTDRVGSQPESHVGSRDLREYHNNVASCSNAELSLLTTKSKNPSLDAALETLTGDVVIMGGYRGSVLRDAEPPNRQLWVPVKVGLNIRKVNLEVGLDPQDEEDMHKNIFASGMLTNIGPVDMSRRLFKRLRTSENARKGLLRVWDYGYDWRLSPHLLSRRLIKFLEGLQCNKSNSSTRGATVIAHSLGGLITRHAANQRPELFAGIVYAGTPQHCVNILGPLRNGDDVLLSSKVLTAQVNFSFRTSFLLLPLGGHCFIDKESKEEYHVDFFDADNWQRYALSPCVATLLPPFNPGDRRSIFGSFYSALPSLLSSNTPAFFKPAGLPEGSAANKVENVAHPDEGTVGMQMQPANSTARTSTLPVDVAMAYLRRTLAEVRQFKEELKHKPELEASNRYPPHALIYSISVPTVYGARVACREAIKHADAYDDLAFAGGDGVVLARAAMIPRGYQTVANGRVRTERGHVSLLGDLEAVGKCLIGLQKGRAEGIGMGTTSANAVNTS